MAKLLSADQINAWHSDGCIFPIHAVSPEEAEANYDRYCALEKKIGEEPQNRYKIKAHLPFPWMWDSIRNDNILDAVEDIIGPDILCGGSSFFNKNAHDKRFVSWHQDSTYYGLEPPESITAWVAFTHASSEAGCMKIIPGSHKGAAILPHDETYDKNNLLARGQTIRDIDPSTAVEMPLKPGQMSIHHNKTIHSSEPNNADWPRVGFAIHFADSSVRQAQFDNPLAIHIRGEDSDGNWVEDPRPEYEMSPESIAAVDEYRDRYRNAMKAQT